MAKIIPKLHEEFINLIAQGVTQTEAYRSTVGKQKSSSDTSRTKGSVLAKRYAIQIAELRAKQQNAISIANESSIIEEALNGILTQAQIDRELCDIILSAKSLTDRLRGIDLYNKRFGSNEAIKTQISIDDKLMQVTRTVLTKNVKS